MRLFQSDFLTLYQGDCLKAMGGVEDNYFDLAVIDPPYGIDMAKKMTVDWVARKSKKPLRYQQKDWDDAIPTAEYFEQLQRVSKNQVIWGGNYFAHLLPPSSCWLVWDKNNGASKFADAELAWTSFKSPVRMKRVHWCGSASLREDTKGKIHSTQKPVALYQWILEKFAKKGMRILDTHLGSGSQAIACMELGYHLEGYEIDGEYFVNIIERISNFNKENQLGISHLGEDREDSEESDIFDIFDS